MQSLDYSHFDVLWKHRDAGAWAFASFDGVGNAYVIAMQLETSPTLLNPLKLRSHYL